MSPLVFWKAGGEATFLTLDGERAELISTRTFAPGSRPEGNLDDRQPIWLKVQSSRIQPDGRFLVSGRLLNATRALRDGLVHALAGPPHDSVPPRDLTPEGGTPAVSRSSNAPPHDAHSPSSPPDAHSPHTQPFRSGPQAKDHRA